MNVLDSLFTHFSLVEIINIFLLTASLIFLTSIKNKNTVIKVILVCNVLAFIQSWFVYIISSFSFPYLRYYSIVRIFSLTGIFVYFLYFIQTYLRTKEDSQRRIVCLLFTCMAFATLLINYFITRNDLAYDFFLNSFFPSTERHAAVFLLIIDIIFMYIMILNMLRRAERKSKKLSDKDKISPWQKYSKILLRKKYFFIYLSQLAVLTMVIIYFANQLLYKYLYNTLEVYFITSLIYLNTYSFFSIRYKKSPILIFKAISISIFLVSIIILVYSSAFSIYLNARYFEREMYEVRTVEQQIRNNTSNYERHIAYVIDMRYNALIYSNVGDDVLDKPIRPLERKSRHYHEALYKNQYRVFANSGILNDLFIESIHTIDDKQYIIGTPYISYREYMASYYQPLVLLTVVVLFALSVLYQLLLKNILLKPIYVLTEMQNRVNKGDYDVVINIESNDEVGDIGTTFNKIIKNVKKSKEELEESYREVDAYNIILEKMVEENTLALREAYQKLLAEKNNREKELKIAKYLQQNLLDDQDIDVIKTSIIYEPNDLIGGDIYDIEQITENHVRVFLADATGHGISAALFATLLKNEYNNNIKLKAGTAEVFEIFNDIFFTRYKNIATFFTSIVVDIFLDTKTIQYSSAGHPVQYAVIDGRIEEMPTTQIMTSILEYGYTPKYNTLKYEKDFKIILFTDGLFELQDEGAELYDVNSLKGLLEKSVDKDLNGLLDVLILDTSKFIGDAKRDDDITLIGVGSNND